MKHISKNFTIHYIIKSLYMAIEITSRLLYCAWATALEVGGIFFGIFWVGYLVAWMYKKLHC